MSLAIRALGRLDYVRAHALQRDLVARRGRDELGDQLLLVEHPHVFTQGRKARDLRNVLDAGDIPVVRVERGGDLTYHGPGQLVAYPILKLGPGRRDAPAYIRWLEGVVIETCRGLDLPDAQRRPGYAGVWCRHQKICSVGVAITEQWVTWHGVALNVCPNLDYFSRINPCGMKASVMSSIVALTGRPTTVAAAREVFASCFVAAKTAFLTP